MATKSIAWNDGSGDYITLTYTGQGNGTVAVTSQPNNSANARSATFDIRTAAGSPVVTRELTVTQGACPVPIGTVLNYAYTGSYQEVTLPAGQYKLQCWGAQGGSNASASSYSISAKSGGKGGYSEGILTLLSATTVKVYVGGQGSSSAGGFNGGGSTTGSSTYNASNEQGVSRMGGGGGATDIRLSDGALLSRMIVAGGGAGGAMCFKRVTSSQQTLVSTINSSAGFSWYPGTHNGQKCLSYRKLYNSTIWTSGNTIKLEGTLPSNFLAAVIAYGNTGTSLTSIGAQTTANGNTVQYIDLCRLSNSHTDIESSSLWEIGRYDASTGEKVNSVTQIRTKELYSVGSKTTLYISTKGTITGNYGIYYVFKYNSSKTFIERKEYQINNGAELRISLSDCSYFALGVYTESESKSNDVISRQPWLIRQYAAPSTPSSLYLKEYKTETVTTDSNDYQVGGVGGGTQGGAYSSTYAGKQDSAGTNGSFGQGANQTTTNYRYSSGAGGGGWYGGGGGSYSDSSTTNCKYSGGGSGFVNTAASAGNRPSGYTGLQLDSGETKAGNTSFPNTAGTGNETGHSGNGYAKITRIASYTVTLRFKDEEDSPLTGASVTVSNSENTYNLTTDSNGEATANMINGTYNLSCSGYSLNPSQITVSSNTTIDVVAEAPSIMDFSYTGAVQNAALKAGTYKIECWGAQGGYRSNASYGGKGGYSTGILNLTQKTNIYVYVGGSGNTGGTSGGFNGGGRRNSYVGGGGASDIRIGQDSLYARIIVAGGGGSDGATSRGGGAGGGTNGQNTTASNYGTGGYGGGASVSSPNTGGTSYFAGINATQPTSTSPTTQAETYNGFGWGGSGSYRSNGYGGAGGGGWFGGVGTYPDGSGDDDKGGGGGSGYVYTSETASNYPSGCLLDSSHYLSDAQTIAGNASMPSVDGGTETGHSGNGYIRITKLT